MKLSANQKYKKSDSKLNFKEWLKEEQMKGEMEIHDNMANADGLKEKIGEKLSIKIGGIQVKYLALGIAIIGIGGFIYYKYKK